MRLRTGCCRLFFALLFLLVLVQGAAGWNVQNIAIKPSTEPVAPGTPVTATYVVHMDSWMTGTTFESKHTLDMYTDLSDPSWDVTMSQIEEDVTPVVSTIVRKSAARARIDGWTLSYASMRIDLSVVLKGVAPNVSGAESKIVFRVQELDESGQTEGSATTRKVQVAVPAAALTPTPAPTTVPPTTVPTTETPTPTPTVKQTYSPGPDAPVICGALAALVIAVAWGRKR